MRNHELDLPGGDAEPKALTPKQTGTDVFFQSGEEGGAVSIRRRGRGNLRWEDRDFFEGEGD